MLNLPRAGLAWFLLFCRGDSRQVRRNQGRGALGDDLRVMALLMCVFGCLTQAFRRAPVTHHVLRLLARVRSVAWLPAGLFAKGVLTGSRLLQLCSPGPCEQEALFPALWPQIPSGGAGKEPSGIGGLPTSKQGSMLQSPSSFQMLCDPRWGSAGSGCATSLDVLLFVPDVL